MSSDEPIEMSVAVCELLSKASGLAMKESEEWARNGEARESAHWATVAAKITQIKKFAKRE